MLIGAASVPSKADVIEVSSGSRSWSVLDIVAIFIRCDEIGVDNGSNR